MVDLLNDSGLKNMCIQSGISYLGLFGSYARDEQKSTSDIDLLVRFNKPIGYFKLVQVQENIKTLLNKDVDLVTENALSKYIKPYVYKDLKTIYGSR